MWEDEMLAWQTQNRGNSISLENCFCLYWFGHDFLATKQSGYLLGWQFLKFLLKRKNSCEHSIWLKSIWLTEGVVIRFTTSLGTSFTVCMRMWRLLNVSFHAFVSLGSKFCGFVKSLNGGESFLLRYISKVAIQIWFVMIANLEWSHKVL